MTNFTLKNANTFIIMMKKALVIFQLNFFFFVFIYKSIMVKIRRHNGGRTEIFNLNIPIRSM